MNIPSASNVREVAQQQKDLYERVKARENENKHRTVLVHRIEKAAARGEFAIETSFPLSGDTQQAFISAGYVIKGIKKVNSQGACKPCYVVSWY